MIETIFYWVGAITCFIILIALFIAGIESIYWLIIEWKKKRTYCKRVWNKAYFLVAEEINKEKELNGEGVENE